MKLSKILRKFFIIHVDICLVLGTCSVVANLLSNFESTSTDWMLYFALPGITIYNLEREINKTYHKYICIALFVLSIAEMIYILVNGTYQLSIIFFGQFIPLGIYLILYLIERGENNVDTRRTPPKNEEPFSCPWT